MIIDAFGRLSAGSNLVVGILIFAIISIVQLLVIAKGSERVAEVTARFNLDGMPGKQMSIDSELRCGGIDHSEAHNRRVLIENESRFYAALDGAMKFVKGDTIASIVIAIINILGGFTIGIFEKGLTPEESIRTYTMLSIGDGLASQITSLIISVSAGLIITKDSSSSGKASNQSELILWPLLTDKTLYIPVYLIFLSISLVPGIPIHPIIIIVTTHLFIIIFEKGRQLKITKKRETLKNFPPDICRNQIPSVFSFEISKNLFPENKDTHLENIIFHLEKAKISISKNFGVFMQTPLLIARPDSSPNIKVTLFGANLYTIPVSSDSTFRLALKPISLDLSDNCFQMNHKSFVIIQSRNSNTLSEGKTKNILLPEFIGMLAEHVMNKHLPSFFGIQELHEIIERLQKIYPALIKEVIPRIISYSKLTELLKHLLIEKVSISNIGVILESVALHGQNEELGTLIEIVRASLKRQICSSIKGDLSVMDVLIIDKSIGNHLNSNETGNGRLTIPAATSLRMIIDNIRQGIEKYWKSEQCPVLITDAIYRKCLKQLITQELPFVHVLSFNEIDPNIKIMPVGKISF